MVVWCVVLDMAGWPFDSVSLRVAVVHFPIVVSYLRMRCKYFAGTVHIFLPGCIDASYTSSS